MKRRAYFKGRQASNKHSSGHTNVQQNELLRLYDAGDMKGLDKLATEITKTDRRQQLAWKLLAIAKIRQAEYGSALAVGQKALKLNPADPDCHNNLGDIFKHTGEFVNAEQCYRNAIRIAPQVARFHSNLGFILGTRGSVNEAISEYNAALKLQPEDVETITNLGILLKDVGKLEDAAGLLRKAISFRGDIPNIHIILGNLLRELGLDEEAFLAYRKAISLSPESETGNYRLGVLLYDHAKYADAVPYLSESSVEKSHLYLIAAACKLDDKKLFISELCDYTKNGFCSGFGGYLIELGRQKYGLTIGNNYCGNAMDYVSTTPAANQESFVQEIAVPLATLLDSGIIECRTQKLLSNGVQTAGNIFQFPAVEVAKIERLIISTIARYRDEFANRAVGLITLWPEKYKLVGWIVSMNDAGTLAPHIHENSWLSGSVYLNVPTDLTKGEGNLILSLVDPGELSGNSTSEGEMVIDVKTGDIVIFPASLMHYTTSFRSGSRRIVLAFDVVPE